MPDSDHKLSQRLAARDQLDPRWRVGALLHADEFDDPTLANWRWELEKGGTVQVLDGQLDLEVPGGATIWFKHALDGPVLIEYAALAVDAGGSYDRVSDLNCFWMARDSRSMDDLFATPRSGQFADYHQLRTYYVGLGGNYNSTTRFRRYIGDPEIRPMLPEHDLEAPETLLTANTWQVVRLVANDGLIQYYRDGYKLFELLDEAPYTSGWFGLRTTFSHLRIDHLKIYRLIPEQG